ncbi:5542_t:CDS:2 [Dentiscutata heterogama]|uniref:5542_t:CDS:1 n=1 Tax=Dentiscutata heterogama TaxID=1316150 RepID=A0ACA9LS72_9GLOM|nr:5542_t:CDS:2 [Dentiscutata heterogama]
MAQQILENESASEINLLDQNRPSWKPFLSCEELRNFFTSKNIEILYQGISRFRQQLNGVKKKNLAVNGSTVNDPLSIVYEYLQSSSECQELFRIWDLQIENNITKLEVPIPDLFAKIIQYTTKTPSLKSTGTIIIRNVLRNYMKVIIRNLSSDRYPLCQATLRLLIMMNSHDITTTRELQESFPYGAW